MDMMFILNCKKKFLRLHLLNVLHGTNNIRLDGGFVHDNIVVMPTVSMALSSEKKLFQNIYEYASIL